MADEYLKKEIEKLQENMKAYLIQLAFTDPRQLPAALFEVMNYRMRLEMLKGFAEFLETYMDKLDYWSKFNKGD